MFDIINISLILSSVPGLLLVMYIYKLDSIEKEPIGLIVRIMLRSALMVLIAGLFETIITEQLQDKFENDIVFELVDNFIIIACTEELLKFRAFQKVTWKNPEFNYRFDAIVYATCSGVGFAILENIFYLQSYGLLTILFRTFTAVPAHFTFAVFMGHYYAQTKFYSDRGNKKKLFLSVVKMFLIPILLHGSYDFIAERQSLVSAIIFVVFVIILDVITFTKIKEFANKNKAF